MGRINENGRNRAAGLLTLAALAPALLAGCGGEDKFANQPRPAAPLQLTGVITEERVTVSPNAVGGGPVVITVSNQTQQSHTLTIEGEDLRETVGPINPLDTGRIQQTLPQGKYEVRAGSTQAVDRPIQSATLDVGPDRKSSSGEVLLP